MNRNQLITSVQMQIVEGTTGRCFRIFSGIVGKGRYVAFCDEAVRVNGPAGPTEAWCRRSESDESATPEEAEAQALARAGR